RDVERDPAAERRAAERRCGPGRRDRRERGADLREEEAARAHRTTRISSLVATTKGARPGPSGGHTAIARTPDATGKRSTSRSFGVTAGCAALTATRDHDRTTTASSIGFSVSRLVMISGSPS